MTQEHSNDTTHHQRDFRVRSRQAGGTPRSISVHATPEQIAHLETEGYMVRERLIEGEHLQRLRDAVDEVEAHERATREIRENATFDGLFVRNLLDRHPAFLEMLHFEPTLSVARSLLGPQVQVHAFVMRVSHPRAENQGVEWHWHQPVVPEPVPRFFTRPHVIDNLIYLDDITMQSGPLCVIPRSHLEDRDHPPHDLSDRPGQVVLPVPAGTCVSAHSSLWHKVMPTRPGSSVRRLLIIGYSPVWMKPVDKFGGGLSDTLLPDADEETRELLGVASMH